MNEGKQFLEAAGVETLIERHHREGRGKTSKYTKRIFLNHKEPVRREKEEDCNHPAPSQWVAGGGLGGKENKQKTGPSLCLTILSPLTGRQSLLNTLQRITFIFSQQS